MHYPAKSGGVATIQIEDSLPLISGNEPKTLNQFDPQPIFINSSLLAPHLAKTMRLREFPTPIQYRPSSPPASP
jgi:hypothetical protein